MFMDRQKYASAGIKHHLATNRNWVKGKAWSKKLSALFLRANMSLGDKANILELTGELEAYHKGPHSPLYHAFVYRTLTTSIGKASPKSVEYANRLRAGLALVAKEIRDNPGILRGIGLEAP